MTTSTEKASHTPGAMRAAKKIALSSDYIRRLAIGYMLRVEFAEAIAPIIDHETAAPEMLNELEINLTVLRDVQKYLRNRPGNEPEQLCEMVGESIAHHEAAIRKAKGEL